MKLPKHKEYVKTLPCCHCQTTLGIDPHHMIGVDKMGAMGATNSDLALMPLCRKDHGRVHADSGKGWPQTRWVLETIEKSIDAGMLK